MTLPVVLVLTFVARSCGAAVNEPIDPVVRLAIPQWPDDAALLLFAAAVSTVWTPETTDLGLDDASRVDGAAESPAAAPDAPATTSST